MISSAIKPTVLVVTLAVGVALGVIGRGGVAAQHGPAPPTVLLATDLAGIEGYELRMLRAELGPGVAGPKHPHPGMECFYVLEGALTLDKEGTAPAHLKTGEAHCVPPGTVLSSRNPSTTEVSRRLLVIIAPKR